MKWVIAMSDNFNVINSTQRDLLTSRSKCSHRLSLLFIFLVPMKRCLNYFISWNGRLDIEGERERERMTTNKYFINTYMCL